MTDHNLFAIANEHRQDVSNAPKITPEHLQCSQRFFPTAWPFGKTVLCRHKNASDTRSNNWPVETKKRPGS
jgi:hypothetical protein